MAASTVVNSTSYFPKNVRPPTVNYTKSKWDEHFTSFSLDHQVQEKYRESIEALKEVAKSMLMADGDTKARKLVLIDTLERLGVAYHFDQEIEEQLGLIFKSHCENMKDEEELSGLFITSLQFRLFRQHGYHVSCGVFDKFIGTSDKKFKESCIDDAKGLLSLYEAAHLRTRGELVLDEAVAFTVHHLKRLAQQLELDSSSPLQDQVKRALEMPLHRGIPRIETRYYISMYEKDDSNNDLLLKLAKLDFNYVQNMHKKELCELLRWWRELKLQSEFSYARSRVVEAYLWATSYNFEPRYSYVRMAFTRVFKILTIIDDTYDNYATVEEADLFTEIMQRWNIDEIDQLPDYMKIVYRLVLSEYDVYECDSAEHGKLFLVPFAKETVKQMCNAYNEELKWIKGQEVPSFEEYNVNSLITAGFSALCMRTIPGLKSVTKETIDWLQSEPKIVVATSMVGRYLDNVSGYRRESKQGLTGLDFYMKQHGVSMQESADKFIELIEDGWKDLNAEWMIRNSKVPKEMMVQVLGYARAAEGFYRSCEDGFTRSEVMAPHIAALFVDPIII